MRTLTLAATLLAFYSATAVAGDAATAQRSTGNTGTRVTAPAPAPTPAPAPVKLQEPVRVAFVAGENRRLVEGKASASSPAVVLWAAPTGVMLDTRLMIQGNAGALVIYQPGAQEPDAGTAPSEGSIRWIGECSKGGDLRLEVHPKSATEVPFRLGLEVVPETPGRP